MALPQDNNYVTEILVVEDSITQAFGLKMLLEKNSYRVTVVENGREALNHLTVHRPRMVISDIDMPELDGYAMCLAIKNNPALRDIPVILLTTLANTEHILEGLKAKADYYLTKPYDPPYLLDRVRTLLNRPLVRDAGDEAQEMEIILEGQSHVVASSRRQMLNLLLSTYENAVQQNRLLIRTQSELNVRNQQMREQSEKLKVSEVNFRNLLENMADGMVVADAGGKVRFSNAAARQLLNQTAAELLGRPFEFRAAPGETHEIVINRDGCNSIIAELRSFLTVWEGVEASLISLRDITQRKRDEQRIREQQDELREANDRLRALATSDGLTGLKNHRTFKEKLAEEYLATIAGQRELSLLLLDVDHFKSFNDTHGHPAGDEVLRQVARILTANARATDVVARYGGEEFAILMPGADQAQATAVAERIRRGIEAGPWQLRKITISVGVATRSMATENGEALIEEADQALYHSKQQGRNRVTHSFAIQRASACK